jgi:methanogenic corrinoid protein MtbC1
MTSIEDFPDEPKYSIKTVSLQTGIRAVTLRAWERRHEILTPQRAENRYRMYSERDVAILRWIKSRLENDISISRVVNELHELQRKGIWPEALPGLPVMKSEMKAPLPAGQYVKLLFEGLIHHDEISIGKLIQEIQSSYDIRTICVDIFTPCLVDIGDAWYHGEIRVTTEHFASAYLRGKLLSILQSYSYRRNVPYFMVGCGPNEQHEIGSLMVAVMLRSHGFRVEYLGPDIPVEDLVDYACYEHPQLVVLTASIEETALGLKHVQERLNVLKRPPTFGFGGRAFVVKAALRKQVPGIYLGDTLDAAVSTVMGLFDHNMNNIEKAIHSRV